MAIPSKTYNTPKRNCIIKTRLTENERKDFERRCAALSMNQSEYIRQAIFNSKIKPVIRAVQNSGEILSALSKLTDEYGKIGSNLNQIARHLNSGGSFYRGLAEELQGAAADLTTLKYETLKAAGEAYGNHKTH